MRRLCAPEKNQERARTRIDERRNVPNLMIIIYILLNHNILIKTTQDNGDRMEQSCTKIEPVRFPGLVAAFFTRLSFGAK